MQFAVFLPVTAEAATLTPIVDSFGVGSDDYDIDNWFEEGTETDATTLAKSAGSGDDSASSDGERFAKIAKDEWICTELDASGLNNLFIKYYWRGDSDAENNEDSIIEYRNGYCETGGGTWHTLATHELDDNNTNITAWSGLRTLDLPNSLDNDNKFSVRFKNLADNNDEFFRIDGFVFGGDEITSKVNICQSTHSSSNPWEAIRINQSAWPAHEAQGDFLYGGPVNSQNQQPTDDGWCENNQPGDLCPNISGLQATIPSGMQVVNNECVPIPTGTLTVIKHIEGGPLSASDFTMQVQVSASEDGPFLRNEPELPGSETGAEYILNEGEYFSVGEIGSGLDDGTYLGESIGCAGTIVANQESVCTITNTYNQPKGSLTIVKNAIGGNGTFEFTVSGLDGTRSITTGIGSDSNTVGGLTPGSYSVAEVNIPDNWAKTGEDNCQNVNVVANQNSTCTITNTYTTPSEKATIVATKIICDSETDLPNWGTGGANITSETAAAFLETHKNCHLQSGWDFQWVLDSQSNTNPGDNLLDPAGLPWASFGPTATDGVASTQVPASSKVWVREILKDGFVEFSGDVNGAQNRANPVSAEMYCNTDVLNYDNYDYIESVVAGQTYYCVAFNAPKAPEIAACPVGTTRSELPVETVTVPANSSSPTSSGNSLTNGKDYLVVASGSWTNSNNLADAEYVSKDNWATFADGYNFNPYFLGEGSFDLQVDNAFVNWGNYNSNHEYSLLYNGNGNPVSFLIFDGDSNPVLPVLHPEWYGDNSGNLEAKIYSCDSEQTCTNTNVTQTIVSDVTTQENSHDSVLVKEPYHPAWTTDISGAKWIWGENLSSLDLTVDRIEVFTKTFTISGVPTGAVLDLATDNGFIAKINGNLIADEFAQEHNYETANIHHYVIPKESLRSGVNVLEFTIKNFAMEGGTVETNPAGLLYKLVTTEDDCQLPPACVSNAVQTVVSDDSNIVNTSAFAVPTYVHPAWVSLSGATWIWDTFNVTNPSVDQTNVFNKTFVVTGSVISAGIDIASDNGYLLKVNGVVVEDKLAVENNFSAITHYDLNTLVPGLVRSGSNTLEITVKNDAYGTTDPTVNPAGLLYKLTVNRNECSENGGGDDQKPETSKVFFQKYIVGSGAAEYSGETSPTFKLNIAGAGNGDLLLDDADNYTEDSELVEDGDNNITVYEVTSFKDQSSDVIPYGDACSPGKFRFAGYGVGDSFENASKAATTTVDLVLSNIDSDKYVVVWNEVCPVPPKDVCANLNGVQTEVPSGYNLENGDQCVAIQGDSNDGTPSPLYTRQRDVSGIFSRRGSVLGASTDGSLMCEPYLTKYIKLGANNDPEEVKKLQEFLNQFFETNNPVTGVYGPITYEMVKKFQAHQNDAVLTPWTLAGFPTDGPTGYVYKTTQRWINILKCPEMIATLPIPAPLVPASGNI